MLPYNETSNCFGELHMESPTNQAAHNLRSARHVREKLDISHITLWRRINDPKLGFPQPLKINGRNFFLEEEILEWVERQKEDDRRLRGK